MFSFSEDAADVEDVEVLCRSWSKHCCNGWGFEEDAWSSRYHRSPELSCEGSLIRRHKQKIEPCSKWSDLFAGCVMMHIFIIFLHLWVYSDCLTVCSMIQKCQCKHQNNEKLLLLCFSSVHQVDQLSFSACFIALMEALAQNSLSSWHHSIIIYGGLHIWPKFWCLRIYYQ